MDSRGGIPRTARTIRCSGEKRRNGNVPTGKSCFRHFSLHSIFVSVGLVDVTTIEMFIYEKLVQSQVIDVEDEKVPLQWLLCLFTTIVAGAS